MSKNLNNVLAKYIHKDYYQKRKTFLQWDDNWSKPFFNFIFDGNRFDSVLDIGCGNGSFLAKCKTNNFTRCVGTDLATLDLGLIKKVEGVEYKNTAASELKFNEGEFDLVTSFECLEHVHEDEVDITLDKMFKFTKNFLCLSIAHRESGETTVEGVNLHLTVKPWHWWEKKLKERGYIFQKLEISDEARTYIILSKKPTLYCDLDSTLNDHYRRISRFTIEGSCDFTAANQMKEVMRDLPLPYAKESIDILKEEYNICIITARPYPNAYKITKSWLDKHNFYYDGIIVTRESIDKVKYVNTKDSLFIDDLSKKHESNPPYTILYDKTIEKLERRRINYILFKGDWLKVINELGFGKKLI